MKIFLKKSLCFLIVLFILFSLSCFSDESLAAGQTEADEWFKKGNAYYDLSQYQRAINDYTKAIELDPKYAGAYLNRGNAYYKVSYYKKSIDDYTKAIKLDPKYTYAYYNRGWAYYNLGKYQKAINDYDKALELDPKYALAYNSRGIAYKKLDQYQKAIDDYTKAIKLDPKYTYAYYNRGNAYRDLGEYQKAIDDYDKALELDPKYASAYNSRGFAYAKIKESQRAILGSIKVTSIPSSAKVFLDAGQYMGKTPLTLNDISPGKHKITLVLVDYEKYAEEVNVIASKTIDFSTTLVSTKPKSPAYGSLKINTTPDKVKVYLNNKYLGVTSLTLDQLKPGDYQLKLSKDGYQDWSKKVTAVASKTNTLSVSLITKPKPVPAYGKLSVNSTPAAQVFLNDKTKGATPLTLDNLESGTYVLKLNKEGYQDLKQEISIIANQVTRISTNLKKLTPAYGSIEIISEPTKAKIYLNDNYQGETPLTLEQLTPATYQLKLTKEGYQDFKQEVQVKAGETTQISAFLSLVPKKEEPVPKEEDKEYQKFFQQGRNYYTGKLYEDSVKAFRKALDIDDTDWQLHYSLGQSYQALEMYNAAIECYKKAIGLNPQEYLHYFNLGNVYNQVRLYKEAINAFQRAISLNPKPDNLYTRIGIAYHYAGLTSEAIKSHNKAIELNPVDTASYSYLADIFLEKKLYDLAISHYQKAIHINSTNEQFHFKLGQTYYESGNYSEAENRLNQAIRIDPTYISAYYFLGLTYVALGDKDSALKQYEILKNLDASLAKKLKGLIGK